MKLKELLKSWPRRLLLQKISKFAIAITLALSVIVVGLSIYMNNVGNFVISIEKVERLSISLSENNDFENNASSILYAKGMADVTNATYANIPQNIDSLGYGNHSDEEGKRYTAYTFFLKNTSSISVAYSMEIRINQLYKNVDAAIRVMVIKDGEAKIYAKRDKDGNIITYLDGSAPAAMTRLYATEPFADERTVCREYTPVLTFQQVVKYTVVMWLEGFDEDCIDAIKGGAIRMSMNFEAT